MLALLVNGVSRCVATVSPDDVELVNPPELQAADYLLDVSTAAGCALCARDGALGYSGQGSRVGVVSRGDIAEGVTGVKRCGNTGWCWPWM